jgi:hypothetical protein
LKRSPEIKKPILNLPVVEFTGREKMRVDFCESILEYRSETVKLKFKGYNLRIMGSALLLSDLQEGSLTVTGNIFSADFTD